MQEEFRQLRGRTLALVSKSRQAHPTGWSRQAGQHAPCPPAGAQKEIEVEGKVLVGEIRDGSDHDQRHSTREGRLRQRRAFHVESDGARQGRQRALVRGATHDARDGKKSSFVDGEAVVGGNAQDQSGVRAGTGSHSFSIERSGTLVTSHLGSHEKFPHLRRREGAGEAGGHRQPERFRCEHGSGGLSGPVKPDAGLNQPARLPPPLPHEAAHACHGPRLGLREGAAKSVEFPSGRGENRDRLHAALVRGTDGVTGQG